MTRAAAVIAVMAAGSGGDSLQGTEVLEHGASLSAGARMADSGLLRVCSSGVGVGVLGGGQHADAGPRWSAWCFSDHGFWWSQAACFWLLSSCSTSLGVR